MGCWPAKILSLQSAIQPAVWRRLYPWSAAFHKILGVEMGACGVGRTGSLDHCQVPLIEQGFERLHSRVESEKPIQVNELALRDGDGRPQLVVVLFCVRHHDIEPICGPALE